MAERRYKSICRIDRPHRNHHAWYVRVHYHGKVLSKHFSDLKYGGKGKALKEAIRFRNAAEEELGKPRTNRIIVCSNPKNHTGVIGVRRAERKYVTKKHGVIYKPIYEVTWCPQPKVMRRTAVSIEKYGEEEAFRMACEIRQKQERKMFR